MLCQSCIVDAFFYICECQWCRLGSSISLDIWVCAVGGVCGKRVNEQTVFAMHSGEFSPSVASSSASRLLQKQNTQKKKEEEELKQTVRNNVREAQRQCRHTFSVSTQHPDAGETSNCSSSSMRWRKGYTCVCLPGELTNSIPTEMHFV